MGRLGESMGVFLNLRVLPYEEMVKNLGYGYVYSEKEGTTEIEIIARPMHESEYALCAAWFDFNDNGSPRTVYVRFNPITGEITKKFKPTAPTQEMERVLYKIVALCTEMTIMEVD